MKKLLPFIVFCLLLCSGVNSYAGKYRLNDARIENMFTNSYNASIDLLHYDVTQPTMAFPFNASVAMVQSADKSAIAAILLCFFFGGLGIHRIYLGTSGGVVVGYCLLTLCFGLGWVLALVDFIFLIVNYDDMSEYEDNRHFFMWTN